jgi:CMP-N,N'-diacetyllegionaminic acid synthase
MIVGVIPARGGSRGIARKNLAICAGKPLLTYTLEAAKASRLDRVIVSTDDAEVADFAKQAGIEVPFVRPAQLASDSAPMLDVLLHALKWLQGSGAEVDAIALLQPTSPLRTSAHIDAVLAKFRDKRADTVVSVVRVPHNFTPESLLELRKDETLVPANSKAGPTQRQSKPQLYARNGPAIVVTSTSTLAAGKLYGERTIAYEMSRLESIDVDEPEDLRLAELLIMNRG